MKLKNRLVIAFTLIALIPMLLFALLYYGISRYQTRSMREDFGIDLPFEDSYTNTPELMTHYTKSIYETINRMAKDDPDMAISEEFLSEVDEGLGGVYSYAVAVLDGEVVYQSPNLETEEILKDLPKYGSVIGSNDSSLYLGGDIRSMVKQIDLITSDRRKGSIYVITSAKKAIPSIRTLFVDVVLMMFLILAVTGACLTTWIYRGVIGPIRKLKQATQNIKKGNLDFKLEVEGHDEVSELCADFEDMRQRLRVTTEERMQYDRENQELISNISHDLKTPITVVKGYVEGIMDGMADTPEKMDRYMKTIYNKTNDMDRLINELTFYTKIDSNRIPYTFHKINLKNYFDDCAEELSIDLEERGMEFSYINRASADIVVIADPEQLKRVIDNIVGNSVKYMGKEHGRIGIEIKDVGDFVQIDLSDDGKGIAMKDLPYIFERFYRADASRNSSTGGSGIGLSIVKKIIEDHGGKIWATSREGEGTVMSFVLRKYQEDLHHE